MAYLMPCDPLQMRSMYQREDSEDSDGEGGLGNVNRVLIRPPEHTGKAKKGHLCFDASFETGNLGRVDLINEYEYDLFIRPDTCSPRFRIWFNFTVDNYKQDQRVIFNIVNFSKNKLLFRNILTPLVKSTTRPYWQRIPRKYVWYHKSNVHKSNYILTFAFAFDREEEIYQFSMSTPYSYSRLQTYLNILLHKYNSNINNNNNINNLYITKDLLATSIQNRNVDLITIGKINDVITTANIQQHHKQHVVVILARIHPGESPTSYVCQGILEYLSSTTDLLVQLLRKHIIFKIIPMVNPDGVYLGNYKTTSMGFDLNHLYNCASPYAHPTIYNIIQMLKGLDDSVHIQLDFVFDLHAHVNLLGSFIYGNTYDDIYRYERHIVFPKLLSYNTDDYHIANTMYNSDINKIGTARRYLCSILSDTVNCYTLYVSMGGYYHQQQQTHPTTTTIIPYTKDSYMRLGRNFIRTFVDYYKMIGVIVTNDLAYELLLNTNMNNEHTSRSRHKERNCRKSSSRHHHHHHKSISPPYIDYHQIRSRSLSYLNTQRKSAIQHYTNIINQQSTNIFNIDQLPTNITLIDQQQQHKLPLHPLKLKTRIKSTKQSKQQQLQQQQQQQQHVTTTLPLPILNYAPLPSLSIIDFNQLTRCGIEKAIAIDKDKLPHDHTKSKNSSKKR